MRTAKFTMHITKCTLKTAYYKLHSAHSKLHTTNYTVHTTKCTPQITQCTLQTANYKLQCTLQSEHCSLSCAACSGNWRLGWHQPDPKHCSVNSLLRKVYCVLYIVYFAVCTVYCIFWSVHSVLFTVQYPLCNVYSALSRVLCTVHCVLQCVVYNHRTLNTEQALASCVCSTAAFHCTYTAHLTFHMALHTVHCTTMTHRHRVL